MIKFQLKGKCGLKLSSWKMFFDVPYWSASWGKCQLGEVLVGESASWGSPSWGKYQLGDKNLTLLVENFLVFFLSNRRNGKFCHPDKGAALVKLEWINFSAAWSLILTASKQNFRKFALSRKISNNECYILIRL